MKNQQYNGGGSGDCSASAPMAQMDQARAAAAWAGPTLTQIIPNRPKARTVNRAIPQAPINEPAFVTIDLPIADATKLRALLGALTINPANHNESPYVRTVGTFNQLPHLRGIGGPFFLISDVLSTALMVHNAIKGEGF